MFKKISTLVLSAIISIPLVACTSKNPNNNNVTKEGQASNESKAADGTVYIIEGSTIDDSGVNQTVTEVSVFDNMTDVVKSYGQSDLVVNDENKDKVTVVVDFEIKNNNKFMISTYPTQAKFVTNTGEQVEADMFASESFDGDIYEGVTKGGHVLFKLEKTPIDDLKSFKMIWSTSHDNGTPDDYNDDYYKDNELEIVLKK